MARLCNACEIYDSEECPHCDGSGEEPGSMLSALCSMCGSQMDIGVIDYWTCTNPTCPNFKAHERKDNPDGD